MRRRHVLAGVFVGACLVVVLLLVLRTGFSAPDDGDAPASVQEAYSDSLRDEQSQDVVATDEPRDEKPQDVAAELFAELLEEPLPGEGAFSSIEVWTRIVTDAMEWIEGPDGVSLQGAKASPSGRFVAFHARLDKPGVKVFTIMIKDTHTGEWFEVPPHDGYPNAFDPSVQHFQWSPDETALLLTEHFTTLPVPGREASDEEWNAYDVSLHSAMRVLDIDTMQTTVLSTRQIYGPDRSGGAFEGYFDADGNIQLITRRRDENLLTITQYDVTDWASNETDIVLPPSLELVNRLEVLSHRNELWTTYRTSDRPHFSGVGYIDMSSSSPELVEVLPHAFLLAIDPSGNYIAVAQHMEGVDRRGEAGNWPEPGNYYIYDRTFENGVLLGREAHFPAPVAFSADGASLYLRGIEGGIFVQGTGQGPNWGLYRADWLELLAPQAE